MADCVFCTIQKDKSVILYEDDLCYSVLDKFPVSKGHLLVIAKAHASDWTQSDDKTLAQMAVVAKMMAKRVDDSFKPRGMKIVSNVRSAGGQLIPHTHLHVIPVYDGSMEGHGSREAAPIDQKRVFSALKG